MAEKPDWARDGRDWPNRASSRFVEVGGLRWHVQQMGQGPVALLVHGTGAATHSWRDLMPLLAADFSVVAMDLPGHGFTGTPDMAGLSLPGMAAGISGLLGVLGVAPAVAVGHSAGAAILARMCLDGMISPASLVSLNGAFLPLASGPAQLFSPLAKLLARLPLIPQAFSWHVADRAVVERLMLGTGSRIDRVGVDFYARLMRRPGHAAAALGMMANWDLRPLVRDLPRLATRLVVVVAENDKTIAPADGRRVRDMVPGAALVALPGLGHLAHEERPGEIAAIVRREAGAPPFDPASCASVPRTVGEPLEPQD